MTIVNILRSPSSIGKSIKWAFLTLLLLAVCFQNQAPAEWKRPLQPSLTGGNLVCLSSHPLDLSKFLVANQSQLFEGSGKSDWKIIWSGAGRQSDIKKILTFPWLPDYVFLLTENKILLGEIGSSSWQVIYSSGNQPEKLPLSFTVLPQDPNQWFVGTVKGLWRSQNAGKTWTKADIFSAPNAIPLLLAHGQKLFIGIENSLFLSLNGSSAREIFTLPKREADFSEVEHEKSLGLKSVVYVKQIHDLIVDQSSSQHFYLGTQSGVFESVDGGYRWTPLPRSGLQSAEILNLAHSSKMGLLFAATPRGIFQYGGSKKTWEALFKGLAQPYSKSIDVLDNGKVIAITGDGFVEYQIKPEIHFAGESFSPGLESLSLFRKLIVLEPSARETHRAVIRYANVSNGKINRWQIASRIAGLLPSFSFGKDFSASNNIDLDRGGSKDADIYIEGPYDTNKGWDADMRWDFGDVVYSTAQTSIDSRGKLMVDLRQDLLTEATRVYFERRRLQADIVYVPSVSEQEHLERLIRLDELTALLDGLTDGFFSERLGRVYEGNSEFNRLWFYQQQTEEGRNGNGTAGNR